MSALRRRLLVSLLAIPAFTGLAAAESGVRGAKAPETFTPRPQPTAVAPALTPLAPGLPAVDHPEAGLVLTPVPVLPDPLGDPMFAGAPPAIPEPLARPPVIPAAPPAQPPSSPPPVVATSESVPGAAVPDVSAMPRSPVTPGRKPPVPRPSRDELEAREVHGTPVADFREFEKACDMPEGAPEDYRVVPPGTRLRARVPVFMRMAPHCRARILDVLERDAVVTVLGGGENGWYRVRGQGWPAAWVGGRLLAPVPQR